MKKLSKLSSKAIGSTAICSLLVACGGSGGGDSQLDTITQLTQNLENADAISATIANDASSASGGAGSISLAGETNSSAASDLIISNAVVTSGSESSQSIAYRFDLSDIGGAELPLDTLSVVLEVGASGSFEDSYRLAVFDIRSESAGDAGAASTFTARSTATDLPSGNYAARLVVNPNWQNAFDTVPDDHDDRTPFQFIEERDNSNNASNVFQIAVNSAKVCAEDGFEDNDSFATATVIPAGGEVSAALCLDDVDFYSVDLEAGSGTSLTFDYTDDEDGVNRATSYVVFGPDANRITKGIAREANDIVINADATGSYYLALYGQRSSHQIIRTDSSAGVASDFSDPIFGAETVSGPQSWLFGEVTLNKLAFSEDSLNDQVINCGRISTQFRDDQPVAYVTPGRFADIHEFRLLTGGAYLIDDLQAQGEWSVLDGDIANPDWYENDFPGYAERSGTNTWRYWSRDGFGYTECTLEFNG